MIFKPGNLHKLAKPAVRENENTGKFSLAGSHPNPFNLSTTISFTLPQDGIASLMVYNIMGQKIREVFNEYMTAGKHAVVWNGRSESGNPVSSGIYISRLKMEGKVETRRMTLVK